MFPTKRSASGHIETPYSAWWRIRDAAGIPDVRIHDLRRTLGSYQAQTGANLAVIGKSLGHADGSAATAIYARLGSNVEPIRQSVDKAVAAMGVRLRH